MRLRELEEELNHAYPDPTVLRKAGDFGASALPPLVPHVHANPVGIEVATALLTTMSPLDWFAVRERLERAADHKLPRGWKPGILLEASLPLAAILCLHCNGYVRQAALEKIAREEFAYPILAGLLNDHVPQVRAAARKALVSFAHPVRAEWLAVARLVAAGQRDDHGWLLESVLIRLSDDHLREATRHPRREVRQVAWEAVLGRFGVEEAMTGALADPDASIKLWAGGLARELRVSSELLHRMLASRVPRVRRDALLALGTAEVVRRCLLDRSPMVQETAARLSPGVDLAQFYRDHLEEHPRACLIGLRRLGNKHDFDLVLPYRDRSLGLETLARLDPQRARPLLEEHLQDERPGLRRQALLGLESLAGQLDPRLLWSRIDERNVAGILRLIRLASKWDGVVYLLRATRAWPERAHEQLKHWVRTYNQRQISPSPAQLEAFRQAREEAHLPSGLKRNLDGI